MVLLLAVHLCNNVHSRLLTHSQHFLLVMFTQHPAYFHENLPKQMYLAAGQPALLRLAVPALLRVSHVRFLHVKVLRPWTVDAKALAHPAHGPIWRLTTLPQQLLVCRVAHFTLVARCIGVKCLQILHVRLPSLCQYVLLLLYLQFVREFRDNIVYQLVVCQRT